jgi:hypothetical protein
MSHTTDCQELLEVRNRMEQTVLENDINELGRKVRQLQQQMLALTARQDTQDKKATGAAY